MKLENFNVVELSDATKQKTEGGWLWSVGVLIGGHILTEILFNPEAHIDAYRPNRCG